MLSLPQYYGWQGSACDCGQNAWQWAGGSGVYNGAVNQKLFQGSLNGAGQPNCGSACGQCYELSTSGFNAYNDGVASGSTITLQIVDACYNNGDHWCGSTSDDYKDSSSCSVHFDIQTGPPGSNGQSAVGSDGQTWNGQQTLDIQSGATVTDEFRWWPNRLLQADCMSADVDVWISVELYLWIIIKPSRLARY